MPNQNVMWIMRSAHESCSWMHSQKNHKCNSMIILCQLSWNQPQEAEKSIGRVDIYWNYYLDERTKFPMKHIAGFAFVVLTFTNPNRLRQINIRLATNAVRFDHIPIMRCAPGAFAKLNLMFHHVEHCLTRWKDIDYPACLIWTIACFNYCITYIHFRHEKLFFSFGLSELSIWTKKTDEGEANWSISAIFALLSWTISTN